MIAEDWKLGKIDYCDWVAILPPSYGMDGSWERSEFKILYENCVMNFRMVGWADVSIRADMWWLGS